MDYEKLAQAVAATIAPAIERAQAPLMERLAALEGRLPERGEKGEPGIAGEVGERGLQGEVGPQGERGEPGPAGERGPAGAPGETGPAGEKGMDGREGRDGLPGVPGAPGEKGMDGKDGRNGTDGKDGLGFDDLDVSYDGERSFVVRFVRGDQVKEFPFKMPVVIERGIFKEGTEYERGDGVTWGGSFWIAQAETKAKPDAGNGDWRLAVKRGREGKSPK